jgi:hypothetical protein
VEFILTTIRGTADAAGTLLLLIWQELDKLSEALQERISRTEVPDSPISESHAALVCLFPDNHVKMSG